MALIRVPQHTQEDLAAWAKWEKEDHIWAQTEAFKVRVQKAIEVMVHFWVEGPCYVAVSWGKDSTVLAHMAWVLREEHGIRLPLVWNCCENIHPWTVMVRDAFLDGWWGEEDYYEVHLDRNPGETLGDWFERGIHAAQEVMGTRRWIGGIRAEESSPRARRIQRGLTLGDSCFPLGKWSSGDVFAYLSIHDLPIHPVYACTRGGSLDRGRLRVAGLLTEL